MTVTIHDCEQRSDQWLALRCGMLTASTIGQMVEVKAPGPEAYTCPECEAHPDFPCISRAGATKGQPTKVPHRGRVKAAEEMAPTAEKLITAVSAEKARPFLAALAAERITGHVEQIPVTRDMWRGIDSEPFARDAYAEHTGTAVREVGFITRDIGDGVVIGYSPDGLVGDDGLLEIKAPRAKSHLLTAIDAEVPAQHMAQLQTGLLVSGRAWIDYVSFAGGMALWVRRVEPLPAWQAALMNAARTAEAVIADLTERYRAATRGLPVTERIPDFDEVELKL